MAYSNISVLMAQIYTRRSFETGSNDISKYFLVGLFLASLLGLGASVVYQNNYCLIFKIRKGHQQNFWQRNGDKIILTLIGAVAGTVLTWIGLLLFGK